MLKENHETEVKSIPQNIIDAIKEIGENFVLFQLFLMTRNTSWKVYKNYVDTGYDISLLNIKTHNIIKVEVKTRQRYLTKNKDRNVIHFTLTENEYINSDFMVAYLLYDKTRSDFFVVPCDEKGFKKVKNKEKWLYKFVVTLKKKDNCYSENCITYYDNWNLITDHMNHKNIK